MQSNTAEVLSLTVSEELTIIQGMNNGLVDPVKVVEYARDPVTALHSKFIWDNTLAAEQYRLEQARKIIRLELIVISDEGGKIQISPAMENGTQGKVIRTYVSLSKDRTSEDSRGYRYIVDVLSDKELREQMLGEAKKDMNLFRRKYGTLSALSAVFTAMDKVLKK